MLSPNITLVLNGIRITNLKMPAAITAARDSQATLDTAAKAWTANYTDLVRTWSTAILANKNPLDDTNVQRQAIAHLLNTHGLEHTVRTISEELTVEAIRDHADEILEALKETADAAGKTLTNAHAVLGDVSLNDTRLIFKLGSAAVHEHTEATEAVKNLRVIDKAWGSLAQLTGFASSSTPVIDRLADTDLPTWERLRVRPDVWEVIRAGVTIDLAITKDEVNRRTLRHQTDRDDRTRQAERAFSDQFRVQHGFAG